MNQNDDKFLILKHLSEIGERLVRMETKMETIERDVEWIKEEDRKQNVLLAEHIQGTVTNRQRLEIEIKNRESLEEKVKEHGSKIFKLEEPSKFLESLKKVLIYVAAAGGAVLAIMRWFK